MVSQSTYLFEETIEDNLRIAKPEATQEEIENACKMASVRDFIMTLSDGYKTQLAHSEINFPQVKNSVSSSTCISSR